MLNLTSMICIFLQIPGVDAEEDNKYSALLSRGFVCSGSLVTRADAAGFYFSAGQAGWDQAESESSGH